MRNSNKYILEAKALFKKLKGIERSQDILREKEYEIRAALQAVYNKQTREAGRKLTSA